MKRLMPVLILLFAFSCKEISFREPQPKGKKLLTHVPKELHGRYLAQKENGDVSEDTIIITANGYRFAYAHPLDKNNAGHPDAGILGDSLVLKSYKGYYFLNINDNPEWLLRVLHREKNGDLIYMAPEQEGVEFDDYLKKLSTQIRIDSLKVQGEMLYQIDPTPKQLVDLVEKGYFSRTLFKKIK